MKTDASVHGLFAFFALWLVLTIGCHEGPAETVEPLSPEADQQTSGAAATNRPTARVPTLNELDLILPPANATPAEIAECKERADALLEQIERLTGHAATDTVEVLETGVALRNRDGRSYVGFFPGGKRLNFHFSDNDIARINLFLPGIATAVLNVRISPDDIIISGHDSVSEQPQLLLMRENSSAPLTRFGQWEVRDPDRLEAFVLELYRYFDSRR